MNTLVTHMLIKKLTRHGNSWALVIEKSILDTLEIDEDTELQLTTDGVSLIFTPVDAETRRHRIRRISERIAKRYDKALRAMADGEEAQ